ncbi:hypothetical protein [Nostoc sp.]|nr:hypothetical protein [Nostoc sp. S13]
MAEILMLKMDGHCCCFRASELGYRAYLFSIGDVLCPKVEANCQEDIAWG